MTAATEAPEHPTAPAVVPKAAKRGPKPKRHRLEEFPPPPVRACSVDQIEEAHPGIKGKLRGWIHRADAADPDFRWLTFCIIRVARAVLIDEVRFRDSLYQRTAMPPAPDRGGGRKPGKKANSESAA